MEWGDRRIRQLLRKLSAPADVQDDELAQSLRRVTGAATARDAVLNVAEGALRDFPPVYVTIVRRVDFDGESSKAVAREMRLAERTFFRYRRAAIAAVAAAIAGITRDGLARGSEDVGLDALALYARGRYLWKHRTAASLERALGYFERAVELDPNFALAHSGIADVHVLTGHYQLRDSRAAFDDARAALDRAFALDVTLPEAHTTLGGLHLFDRRDHRRAHEAIDTALSIDPNYTAAHQVAAFLAFSEADVPSALEHVRAALARDPDSLDLQTTLGIALRIEGRSDRAIDHLSDIVALDPDFSFARYELARVLTDAGRFDEALEHLQILQSAEWRYTYDSMTAYVEALSGRPERAQKALRERHVLVRGMRRPHYMAAWLQVALGDTEGALRELGLSASTGEPWAVYSPVDGFFRTLRGDARFRALLELIGQTVALPLAS